MQVRGLDIKEATPRLMEVIKTQLVLEGIRAYYLGKKQQSWKEYLSKLFIPTKVPDYDQPRESTEINHLASKIPKEDRPEMLEALTTLRKQKVLTWNEKGELISGDNLLKGSDVTQIVNYLFKEDQLKRHKPVGTDTFLALLLDSMNFIKNRQELEIRRNGNGGYSVFKFGYNLLDVTVKLAQFLHLAQIPWWTYVGAALNFNLVNFKDILGTTGTVAEHFTKDTMFEGFAQTVANKTGDLFDYLAPTGPAKAGVFAGLKVGYNNAASIATYLTTAASLLTAATVRRRANVAN